MPCYHPLIGYRSRSLTDKGKRAVVFNPHDGYVDQPVVLPCGQCIGCRLERSRQWAVRCMHEASLYDDNCFITLTYENENLPSDGSLNKSHFQKFMKRLRKSLDGVKVRYYHCGEYGDLLSRPHYHACLFGWAPDDKSLWSIRQGVKLYRSSFLEKIWPYGYVSVGDVTFESAAYVARYILKKINGDASEGYYGDRLPPYTTMSRRPGIGAQWMDKYGSDVYPDDFVVVRGGIKCRPPRYYDSIYDSIDPKSFSEIRKKRLQSGYAHAMDVDNSPSRRTVREEVKLIQCSQLKRSIHDN